MRIINEGYVTLSTQFLEGQSVRKKGLLFKTSSLATTLYLHSLLRSNFIFFLWTGSAAGMLQESGGLKQDINHDVLITYPSFGWHMFWSAKFI